MNRLCDEAFARSRLAGNQNGREHSSDFGGDLVYPLNFVAVSEQAVKAATVGTSLGCFQLQQQFFAAEDTAYHEFEVLNIERLLEDVDCSSAERLLCPLPPAIPTVGNDRHWHRSPQSPLKQPARVPGTAVGLLIEIDQNYIRILCLEALYGLFY